MVLLDGFVLAAILRTIGWMDALHERSQSTKCEVLNKMCERECWLTALLLLLRGSSSHLQFCPLCLLGHYAEVALQFLLQH